MPDLIYNVTYQDFAGVQRTVQIRVGHDIWTDRPYYATDLGAMLTQPEGHKVLGCGKNAGSPENAIYKLVSDHGTLLKIEEVA